MATLYSTHYNNLYVAMPKVEVDSKDFNAKVRQIYIPFTITAGIAVNDVIKLAKLPASCKLIGAELVIPDTGATGGFSLGWAASVDGSIAADPDGIIVAADIDSGAAAVFAKMELNDSVPGLQMKFAKPVDIELVCTVTTTATVSAKLALSYISE